MRKLLHTLTVGRESLKIKERGNNEAGHRIHDNISALDITPSSGR